MERVRRVELPTLCLARIKASQKPNKINPPAVVFVPYWTRKTGIIWNYSSPKDGKGPAEEPGR